MTVKITPTRAATINVTFREALGEKVPYQGRSNSRHRMLEAMREEGLLYEYESPRQREKDQPEKPKALQTGPTPKAMRAYIEKGFGMGDPVRDKMQARIPELEAIEAEYEAAMQTFFREKKVEREARAVERRAAKVVAFRAFFAEEGIDLGERDDDAMLDLVERIVNKEMAL